MITINKTIGNYDKKHNILFKSKIDYKQIYKDMEKITLHKEEKILKKTNFKEKLGNLTNNIINKISIKNNHSYCLYNIKNYISNLYHNVLDSSDPGTIFHNFTIAIGLSLIAYFGLTGNQSLDKNEHEQYIQQKSLSTDFEELNLQNKADTLWSKWPNDNIRTQ